MQRSEGYSECESQDVTCIFFANARVVDLHFFSCKCEGHKTRNFLMQMRMVSMHFSLVAVFLHMQCNESQVSLFGLLSESVHLNLLELTRYLCDEFVLVYSIWTHSHSHVLCLSVQAWKHMHTLTKESSCLTF